jgi:hypothetical protein
MAVQRSNIGKKIIFIRITMKRIIGSVGVTALMSAVLFAGAMTPCERLATSVPDDSWSTKEWREYQGAARKWREKKGTDVYTQDDPDTSAYRVPGDHTSCKELAALREAGTRIGKNASEEKNLADAVPSDSWNCVQWRAYRQARAAAESGQ